MRITVKYSVLLPALIVALLAQDKTSQWKVFNSSAGFSVTYPADWFPKGISTDRLTVLSSKKGAQATIIAGGEAMISVSEEEEPANQTMNEVVNRYLRDTTLVSRREIHIEGAASRSCKALNEIVSKEGIVPPEDVAGRVPYVINTQYFCEIDSHIYVTVLRNFEGDRQQALYVQIAQQMAKSLRVVQKVK